MSTEVVHVGRRIRVEVNTLHTPAGHVIRRDAIRHPGAVVILPVLDAERIVLLRNFRFVVGETLWEVPAGTVEPNEPLQLCAERELHEETGYHAAKWRSLGFIYASPGLLDEKLHLFIAEELTPGPAKPEPDETLEPVIVNFADAIRMCLDGTIRDAKTITSLLLWERMRGKERSASALR
jgi:ADP-ribose pyrophosphatase